MTKKDVASKIADRLKEKGVSPEIAEDVINAFTKVVKQGVADGQEVTVRGFGTFKPIVKRAKTARNITQGTTIVIPEHMAPKFIPGKEFADKVREGLVIAE